MDVFEYMILADDGCPNCPAHVSLRPGSYPAWGQWFRAEPLVLPLPIVHSDFVFDIKILEVSRGR